MPSDRPQPVTGYAGPAPTLECIAWLRLVGMSLWTGPICRYLVTQNLPMCVNVRARGIAWSNDGTLALDMKLRHVGGHTEFKSVRVPVEMCLAHDTRRVLGLLLAGITERSVRVVEQTILNETSLRHVAG